MSILPRPRCGWLKQMASLSFPQLSSGALAQYPIRRRTTLRTIKNILADGSMILLPDPGAGQLSWQLSYSDLRAADMNALQDHFQACAGPLRSFIFLDPTENLLTYSADLTGPSWITPAGVTIESGLPDPLGGAAAFRIINGGSATQEIVQTLTAPVNYQYCLSVYATSTGGGTCSLARSGTAVQQLSVYQVKSNWSRIFSSGRLNDTGTDLSVAISLAAGQSISLFGPQLEPQIAPSRFRPTYSRAGVYTSAHWAVQELVFTADAPNLFSTSFTIETSIWN
jgi:hypothetical protein